MTRAEIEAKRGIIRDENGVIIRSKEWKETRIAYLESKIADKKHQIKNAEAEIKQLKAELN